MTCTRGLVSESMSMYNFTHHGQNDYHRNYYSLWSRLKIICFKVDAQNYGIDWQGPIPDQDPDSVEVPETTCPFTEEQVNNLPTIDNLNSYEGSQIFNQITGLSLQ